ncbi:L-seryl-tRNA selenium transferase [Geobacter metallireducens RCH3]|uniref:L-seryl-tRNA(Sec) selenium transferase n=1 Tax=Geobacter metallireducens (strain ATCC 53774 / DSM 7210 / GS-15) TaxID=269799 RepID=SELA_GEOMG|nr:L-seryl-tRNA(Sec) selenium transferase [Geobacter metallireducens]Q39ZL4.1 RecName: Full=L-seryl-tRNA(Sec) selenium transferase; AltName: Full=Selenocysteine synthase; Short=Sec synthase; AltName: Full=Selenocysteinyl-tRNA(Sec) synthase [Geobacter metallireducens GS-15]ABB30310.1 L-seryl-tRNA(Sec) selenium transferase [Geobacter metallireducens GS-15]EHP84903.1 L-seryl-tRNA selenium transferase [Geobacter metallireducens RCH3]
MTLFARIPKVDKILEWDGTKVLLGIHPRPTVLNAVRSVLDSLRTAARSGFLKEEELLEGAVASRIEREVARSTAFSLRRVVNGTGVVIHTNLGRSPLSKRVKPLLDEIAFGYSNLEFDLEKGERGSRYSHVERLLCDLTGAEAALVVNNNAAAVLLALSALAAGKEVVVSRGELVEIGGSFRIPDVMGQGGAILREVGTTNRTHPRDYHQAVSEQTALLLKVHSSNFAVVGFTAEVSATELVAIGKEHSVPVMADIGSGCLLDLSPFGIRGEPTVQEFVKAGVDVITFSGDKLLGGPQAGIIVGRREFIAPLTQHPLLRALRIDKLTLAALEGTLRLYRDERLALAEIPTLRMLTASAAELATRARSFARRIRRASPPDIRLTLTSGISQVGGGAYPLLELPTTLMAMEADGISPQEMEIRLRGMEVPVTGRIHRGRFLLDVRTLQDDDIPFIAAALSSLAD